MTTETAAPTGQHIESEEAPIATLRHGATIISLAVALAQHVAEHRLGRVFAPQTTYHLPLPARAAGSREPKRPEREPDLTFVARDRLPRDLDVEADFAPDLAVEVVSPTDTFDSLTDRVAQYLAAGTRLVWVVRPRTGAVEVYRPGVPPTMLSGDATLSGEDVVPGFQLPLRTLWESETA